MATLPDRTSLSLGSSARIGAVVMASTSGLVRRRSSNWSRTRAMPIPTRSPATRPMSSNLLLLRPVGEVGKLAVTRVVT